MRGGVSDFRRAMSALRKSSPHAWGCFLTGALAKTKIDVFPTCVGVFPDLPADVAQECRLPHMRGGVSPRLSERLFWSKSSPHAWGCFHLSFIRSLLRAVFPTCVGVFLSKSADVIGCSRLPHMRGGVSSIICGGIALRVSSPHAWGCFPAAGRRADGCRVFPTCVGVFLHHV